MKPFRSLLLRLSKPLRRQPPRTMNHKEKVLNPRRAAPSQMTNKASHRSKWSPRSSRLHYLASRPTLLSQCVLMTRIRPLCMPWSSRVHRCSKKTHPGMTAVPLTLRRKARVERPQPQRRSRGSSKCLQPLQLPTQARGPGQPKKERASPLVANQRSQCPQGQPSPPTLARCRILTRQSRCTILSRT